jgi:alkylation response protein AidB-like acyl-CoA dehydrogenase
MTRTIEALVAEVQAHHDEFEATAAEADRLGHAPDALDGLMRTLRVPMVKAPVAVGGDELGLAEQFAYFEALSYANATAGWTGFNHAGAAGMAGAKLPDDGARHVFGGDPSPVMAAVAAPSGRWHRVDGGVVATGTWHYASGVRHADWALLSALEAGTDRPAPRVVVVPIEQATVEGDWDVMALKGTGSISVTLDDVFVPDALVIDPTAGVRRGGPMYLLGYQAYVAPENLGFTIGVCQRFFDELARYACGKARSADGRLADRGAFQYELGKGQLAVRAARAFGADTFREADTVLSSGRVLTGGEQQEIAAVLAWCTEHAANAVSHLFHFAGAGALFSHNVLQRCFRDAHGSVQHQVASNVVYDRLGRTLLGRAEGH